MKYKWAEWTTTSIMDFYKDKVECDFEGCNKKAFHIAIATEDSPYDAEDVIIKARCEEHFTKSSKRWLKIWRKKNIVNKSSMVEVEEIGEFNFKVNGVYFCK